MTRTRTKTFYIWCMVDRLVIMRVNVIHTINYMIRDSKIAGVSLPKVTPCVCVCVCVWHGLVVITILLYSCISISYGEVLSCGLRPAADVPQRVGQGMTITPSTFEYSGI